MSSCSTLDLDTKRGYIQVIKEILKCNDLMTLEIQNSPSKRGFHIILYCKISCLKCRRKYDDGMRYNLDMTKRKSYQRNVLHDKKEMHFPNKDIIKIYEKGKSPVIKRCKKVKEVKENDESKSKKE